MPLAIPARLRQLLGLAEPVAAGAAAVPLPAPEMPAGDAPSAPAAPPAELAEPVSHGASVDSQTLITHADGTPAWVTSQGPFPPDRAFDWGTIDGARAIDKEHFEGYLERSVDEELGRTLVAEAEADVALWRSREADALAASAAVVRTEAELAEAEARAARKTGTARLRAEHAAARAERADAEAEARAAEALAAGQVLRSVPEGRGSRAFAAVYLAAAAVFILGDIGIAQATVADALGFDRGDWHGLVFAIGLGALSVLLKPVYDRLIEDPYHEGRTRPFRLTILPIAGLVVLSLLALGYFRSESYVAQQTQARAQAEIEQVGSRIDAVMEDGGLSDAEREAQAGALRDEQATLAATVQTSGAGLAGSPWGRLSFVLAGLLFALAGAVCLGIGMRHARDHWHLRVRPARRAAALRVSAGTARDAAARARAEADALRVAAEASPDDLGPDRTGPNVLGVDVLVDVAELSRTTLAPLRAAVEAARTHAAGAWALDVCREQLDGALQRRLDALRVASQARREKLVHLYRDGYELGLGRPDHYGDADKATGGDAPADGQTERRRQRPFLELRRAIAREAFGTSGPGLPLN